MTKKKVSVKNIIIGLIISGLAINYLYSNYWGRHTRPLGSDGGSELHHVYIGCLNYWRTTNPKNKCTLEIASKPEFNQFSLQPNDKWTVAILDGEKDSFHAVAYLSSKRYKEKAGILVTMDSTPNMQAELIYHNCNWLKSFPSTPIPLLATTNLFSVSMSLGVCMHL